jgi:hypothetical protein
MKKFKIIADFAKEERFLNDMAKKGYRLEKYNSLGVYTFRLAEPQNLCYRIDYRTFSDNAQFEDYCTLFQDAGWEHVYGTRRSGSQYFLPISDRVQTDDIFSDKESKAGRYKRFAAQCFTSLTLMLVLFIILKPHNWALWDIRSWYFADGLWEMSGSMFWKAFLFETPFVILRVVPFLILLFLAILI